MLASTEVLFRKLHQNQTSITDAYALLKTLKTEKRVLTVELQKISVIANRVVNENDGLELYNKLGTVVSKFLNINISYLGEIQWIRICQMLNATKPVTLAYPDSKQV